MSDSRQVGELDVNQDLDFQRKHWKAQRVGWMLMVGIVLAAMLGVFGGSGPLARATVGGESDPLRLHYSRIARRHAPIVMEVEVAGGTAKDGQVEVVLDREYVRGIQIERIVPEPESEAVTATEVVYHFQVADPARPKLLTFHLQPEHTGSLRGRVGLAGKGLLAFHQFVYP